MEVSWLQFDLSPSTQSSIWLFDDLFVSEYAETLFQQEIRGLNNVVANFVLIYVVQAAVAIISSFALGFHLLILQFISHWAGLKKFEQTIVNSFESDSVCLLGGIAPVFGLGCLSVVETPVVTRNLRVFGIPVTEKSFQLLLLLQVGSPFIILFII